MAKPASLPVWATTGTVTEPSTGYKQAGFVVANNFIGPYVNWLLNLIYQWCVYLDGLQAENLTWTGSHTFTLDVTMSDDLTVTDYVTADRLKIGAAAGNATSGSVYVENTVQVGAGTSDYVAIGGTDGRIDCTGIGGESVQIDAALGKVTASGDVSAASYITPSDQWDFTIPTSAFEVLDTSAIQHSNSTSTAGLVSAGPAGATVVVARAPLNGLLPIAGTIDDVRLWYSWSRSAGAATAYIQYKNRNATTWTTYDSTAFADSSGDVTYLDLTPGATVAMGDAEWSLALVFDNAMVALELFVLGARANVTFTQYGP